MPSKGWKKNSQNSCILIAVGFFSSLALTAQNSPELHFRFIDSPIQSSVLKSVLLCNNLPNFVFAEIILYNRSHVNSRALPNLKTAIANTCHSRFILEICTETREIKTIQCEELFNKDHLNEKGPVHNWRYQFFLNCDPLKKLGLFMDGSQRMKL